MLDVGEHAALVVCVLDLLHLDDLGLFEHLDGIEALIVLRLDQVDSPEATGAERPQDVEIAQRVLALCDAGGGALARLLLMMWLVLMLLLFLLAGMLLLLADVGSRWHGGLGKGLLLLLLHARGVCTGAGADGLVDGGA